MVRFGSVCSGIEAASVAWEPLGWEAQWFAEIEHFPSAVLAHRFPSVPNLGDMTRIHEQKQFQDATINLLVGGTPCQSFSVAGLRKGLDDSRGGLMLTFVELAARKRPTWVVWENVPGVLSSNGGRDFASFLGLLTGRNISSPRRGWKSSGSIPGIGSAYGVAWRVLDAQHFGVAQRRRRVFVVGYLGDWRPAAAVLFEQDCLSGNPKKSREKRKATSSDAQGGSGGRGFRMTAFGEYADDDSASTLKQRDYKDATDLAVEAKASWWNGEQTAATLTKQNANGAQRMPDKDNLGAVLQPVQICFNDANGTRKDRPNGGLYITENPTTSPTITQGQSDLKVIQPVTHAFKVRGGSEVETGEQGGTPGKKAGKGYLGSDELAFTIGTTQDQQIAQPIAFQSVDYGGDATTNLSPTLRRHDPMAVAQPVPFRKAKRAQSKDDHETWEQDEKTNTLNAFDTGDIRTTQAVVQPIAVDTYNQTINEHTTQTIGSSASDVNHYGAVLTPQAVDFRNQNLSEDVTGTLQSKSNVGYSLNYQPGVLQPTMAIRRLTPTETERLQGFPDGWTKIPYRNKPAEDCPDGPRYKACGNSMAVPVMHWIGKRIQMVIDLLK